MNVRPLHDRILVKCTKADDKTAGGLFDVDGGAIRILGQEVVRT